MKTLALLFLLTVAMITVSAQSVGIGTATPDPSALLDIQSSDKGVLIPRMSSVQRSSIATPSNGLLVYDTTTSGFWYYNGTEWTNLGTGGTGSGDWKVTGNMGTSSSNFIGTADNMPLQFKVNSTRTGFLDTNGSIFFGKDAGLNTSGAQNVALGSAALQNSHILTGLVAVGDSAMFWNGYVSIPGYGIENVAVGAKALFSNSAGSGNTGIGWHAAMSSSNAYYCTAVGAKALASSVSNGNTAVGHYCMSHNINGISNTAIGASAMLSNISGDYNAALGSHALVLNTLGNENSVVGYEAAYFNVSGSSNVVLGTRALRNNKWQSNLVAIGDSALYWNLGVQGSNEGTRNTAVGSKTLYTNTDGFDNTAIGFEALYSNTIGDNNIALGREAMYHNTSGYFNSALGSGALGDNTTGYSNTALGYATLFNNTTGYTNVAVGGSALLNNTTGYRNTAVGILALKNNTTGFKNVAIGEYALYNNITGQRNTALGESAGYQITGSDNTCIGAYTQLDAVPGDKLTLLGVSASANVANLTNATALGYNATVNASNKVMIGNTSVTSIGGYAGWSNFSDARFKQNVSENVPGLAFITQLRPVTYTLDIEGINSFNHRDTSALVRSENLTTEASTIVHTGFMAQEVEAVAQSLNYDFTGVDKPADPETQTYALRYGEFVVPLVKAIQEQQEIISALQKQIDDLSQIVNSMTEK